MSLQKVLSNHLPTCAIHNGSTTCTCGIEAASADLAVLQAYLEEEKARNELFSDCLHRALMLFRKSRPETNFFPDGADNFAWLFEQVKKAEEIDGLEGWHTRLTNQLREATELLAAFAEQAETLDHTGCDDDCEYKQAVAWMQKYIEVKPCNK